MQIPFVSDLNDSENQAMDIQMISKAETVPLVNKHWVKQNFVSIFKAYGHGQGTHVLKEVCSPAVRLSSTKKCSISKIQLG